FVVLLIDVDGKEDRLQVAKAVIPERLAGRVFVLGVWSRPEALKSELGAYESIGSAMADDCREETDTSWGHKLLRHNAGELERGRPLHLTSSCAEVHVIARPASVQPLADLSLPARRASSLGAGVFATTRSICSAIRRPIRAVIPLLRSRARASCRVAQ